MKFLQFLSLILLSTQFAKSSPQSGISKQISTPSERDSLSLCPKHYIDVLARCPEDLACNTNEDCSSSKVCCSNACATRTCVYPWYPKDSVCVNTTCPGQGKQCKVINNTPSCVCIDSCSLPTSNRDFICGSDGMGHFSKCFMDRQACREEIRITETECNSVPTPNTNVLPLAENSDIPDDEMQPPRAITVPSMKIAKEGDTVVFRCHVSGVPPPTIFWSIKPENGLLIPGYTNNKLSVSPTTGDLEILKTTPSDNGDYTCNAVNSVGEAQIRFTLLVRTTAPRTILQRLPKIDCGSLPSEQARRCSRGSQRHIKRHWVYNKSTKRCTKLYFRDCDQVTNKFLTQSQCVRACIDVCRYRPIKGECKHFVQRIYYDRRSGRCLPFVYGGCKGNGNNFPDVTACRKRCPSQTVSPCENDTITTLPTTKPTPSCPTCFLQLSESYCRAEFIVVGVVQRIRSERTQEISKTHHPLRISLTSVMLDRSSNLNLLSLNLKDPEQARMEINLDLDATCPCPDVYTLFNTKPKDASSRRNPAVGRSSEITVILIGRTVNGVPTLDSKGFLDQYTDQTQKRIHSFIGYPNFCETTSNLSQQLT